MQLVITIGTRVIIFQIYFVEYYVYQICLGFYWVAVKQELRLHSATLTTLHLLNSLS